jgi:hypothetical protein
LLLGVGLALDTGNSSSRAARRRTARCRGVGRARVLYAGGSAAQARYRGGDRCDAQRLHDGGFVTVTPRLPPASGTYANDPGYIEVTITEQVLTRVPVRREPVAARAITGPATAGLARSGQRRGDRGHSASRISDASTLNGSTRLTVSGGGRTRIPRQHRDQYRQAAASTAPFTA